MTSPSLSMSTMCILMVTITINLIIITPIMVTCDPVRDESPEDPQQYTNYFVDDILQMFRDSFSLYLDPLKLPTQRVVFSKNFLGIPLKGEVLLFNGLIRGLSNLKRTQDANLGPDEKHNSISADLFVGVRDLNMTGWTKCRVMGINAESHVLVTVSNVEAQVSAHLSQDTGRPVIDRVVITVLDGVGVQLPDLGSTSSTLVDVMAKAVITLWKGSLKQVLEKNLMKYMTLAVHRTKLQVGGRRRRRRSAQEVNIDYIFGSK